MLYPYWKALLKLQSCLPMENDFLLKCRFACLLVCQANPLVSLIRLCQTFQRSAGRLNLSPDNFVIDQPAHFKKRKSDPPLGRTQQ
jgi:hypothetical protein